MTTLTDLDIQRWQNFRDEAVTDAAWITRHKDEDARRVVVREEILDLLNRFLSGQANVEELRATFDRKTRKEWDVFGLKGTSGAMFLNTLVKHLPDALTLTQQLCKALPVPRDPEEGRQRMQTFFDFVDGALKAGIVKKSQVQPIRTPFFLSAWWHLQEMEAWPIFFISARRVLEQDGLYTTTQDPVEDYFTFRDLFLSLASKLGLKSWELEHLCVWREDQREDTEEKAYIPVSSPDQTPSSDTSDQNGKEELAVLSHTQTQWMLAKIGRKLGCQVWIAGNDRSKEWNGEKLGDLSLKALPSLGMGHESERIIHLIDVLWLRGGKQIAAAFEIELTTSVYSGLLRMSDLIVLSPNLNFPLYIVAPEARLEKVRRELSRPTFQYLELHKRCSFFSNEDLLKEYDHIVRWASDPTAIERLASKVGDVSSEEEV